ncbi:hypothetical protein P4B35_17140 [Pontiellaceae bacterium B12227]|nr:hypothetical protein [Pontiellaceae bacterium B12227]
MKITQLDQKNKKHRVDYLNVPLSLCLNNPDWQPVLRSSEAFDLSPAHPFYEHSEAAFFTATENQRIKGRIAVLNNRNFNQHRGCNTALFTHFACEEHPEAAALLFDAAANWAKSRNLKHLLGPIGFLQTDARGLMVSGYGKMTSFALPYSPPYYADLFSSNGFTKHSDYLSAEVSNHYQVSDRILRAAAHLTRRSGKEIHTTRSRRRLREIAPVIFEIYCKAGKNADLFYPISETEKQCIIARLAQSACPSLIHWMTDRQDQICGLQMNLPNYAEAFRRTGCGRLARTAAFLQQRHKPKEINIAMTYLLPEAQGRGFNLSLYLAGINSALAMSATRGLVGPVHDQNRQVLSVLSKMDIEFDIVHRLFQREIL